MLKFDDFFIVLIIRVEKFLGLLIFFGNDRDKVYVEENGNRVFFFFICKKFNIDFGWKFINWNFISFCDENK